MYKYEGPLLSLIEKELEKESLIRDHEMVWFLVVIGAIYFIFAFSYLRERNIKVKVTRKELIQRVKTVINDDSAFQTS